MDLNQLAKTATYAGEILLENGAETYRVEDTMNRICHAYGASVVDSFATPTLLIVSFSHEENLIHNIKRIHNRSVDLNKIDEINTLSRSIHEQQLSISQFYEELEKIRNKKRYSQPMTLFFSAVCTFGFAFFFQGTLKDACCAFVIGIILQTVMQMLSKLEINAFFNNVIGGATATLMAIIMQRMNLMDSLDTVIISSMMLLVPGLAITNAIRDTVSGDLISGLSRTAEAFLVAIAIALGSAAVFMLLGGF